jgi:hypothetical protein
VGKATTVKAVQWLRFGALVGSLGLASCSAQEKAKANPAAPDATAPDAAAPADASVAVDGSFAMPLSPAAAQLESWDAALDAAQCDASERCAAEVGSYYASRVDCTRRSDFEMYSRFHGNVSHYEALAKVFTLGSESARQACLDTVRSRPCSETVWPSVCDAVLVPLNPLGEGAACDVQNGWTPNVPCAEGLWCNTGMNSRCGVCGAPPALLPIDGRCSTAESCLTGFCDPRTNTCRPSSERRGEGAPCSQFDCLPGLVCVGPFGHKICMRYAKEGESCDDLLSTTFPPCLIGLGCFGKDKDTNTPGHCENHWLPDGAPCRREGADRTCREFCIFPSADAEEGTCATSWPASKDFPCVGATSSGGKDCPASHYPDVTSSDGSTPASCVCHLQRANGAACSADVECMSRRCAGSGSAKKCTTPGNPYGRCASDSDCVSGYCNPLASWCDNPTFLCPPRVPRDGG